MTQLAYGTITITDTNDIESIIIEYAQNQNPSSAPESGWSTNRPAWAQGYYMWQRTRTHKAGTETSEDTYGTAVCITGSTGSTGAAGRSLSSTVTHYTIATSSATINQSNMGSYTWTTNVPSYNASYPTYWVRVTNTYSNPSSTEYIFYKDQGITDAVKTSHDANTTAGQAKTTADAASQIANQTQTNLNNYINSNDANITALQSRLKRIWINENTSGDYVAGTYAASGINGTTFSESNPQTYGYNTLLRHNMLALRYNTINMTALTTNALTFYVPTQDENEQWIQGKKGLELTSDGLSLYNPTTSSQNDLKALELTSSSLKFYASDGTTAQAEFGGSLAKVSGQLIAQSGYIGTNETNRWFIGNRKNYDQTDSAALVSYGSAYIQLGEDGCWRLSTNRLHTGWNAASGSNVLHYPKWNNIYWDFGIHAPTQNANKFIYIRNYDSTDSGYTEAQILRDLQDNFESNVSVVDSWQYRFYVTAEGSLYAKNIYVLDDNGNATQIGGTDGVYLLKSGGTITGNLEVNGTLTKGGKNVAYLTAAPTNGQILVADGTTGGIKTSGYTIATSVPSNAVFTDKNVQTTKANTTKIYLTGTQTNGTNTGTLNFDEYVYVGTTAGALYATTFNGYTLAAAAAKGVDTSMTSTSTSTNLPTTKAVADLIATYLPLAGGTVSGAVDINDELYADSATFGNLIVNGVGRFTNGIYGDLIGSVTGNITGSLTGNATTATTATKVGNNLIIKLNSGTTEGTNMFTYNGSAAKTVDITKSAIGLGNVENKSSATIRGELTSSNVTTALGFTPYNSTNPNGYVSSSGVTSITLKAGNGISLDTDNTAITTTGTRIISHSDTSSQTSSSNSGRTYIQSVTLDDFGHVTGLSTATETVTNTDTKLQVAAVTSGTTYYPIVGSGTTAATRQYDTTGFVYVGTNGTTSAVGSAKLTLGNSTASGAANNKQGQIVLYGSTAYTTTITPGAPTAARTITLSDKTGTIALTSDIPSSLKNPNALSINIYNATTQTDSGYTTTNYDGSTSNQSINVAGNNAITNITSNTNGQLVIQRASGVAPETVTVKITATTSDTAASADKLNLSTDAGSVSVPVYVPANTGIPIAVESIAYSLLPTGTSASTVAVGNHTHGNITNGGDITAAAPTVANGDQIIINDHSASKITNGPTFDGSTTTKALTPKGTWETFNNYSLPLAANGTRGGVQIGYTQSGKNYPVELSSEKMYVNVPWTDTTYSAGNGLRLNGTQFINTRIPFVAGTQTAQTGSWTGVCNDITALYDGLTIAYWLPRAGSGNATLNLTINGNDTGAKNCYYSGTTRLTTHFGAGNIIYLTYQSAANINGTTYEGWWANANYDSNDTGYYHRRIYPNMKAGSNKIYPYTLIMQLPDGRWESLVTSNSTGTSKARNTHGFLLGHILLMYYNETYTENQNLSTYRIWSAHTGLIDHRYSFNTANDATNGTIGYKPIYLVGSLGSDGLFYLAEKWWTQTLPTTADGKIYIYIGDAYDYYRMTFTEDKPMYIYTNGKLREFSQDAATVAGYTIAKDVPSNAVFTDTWKALSTSQAGYVAQAPNDTGKFLRGDATWAAVTKANVGLGNVENTALSTWTGSNKITTLGTITTGTWNGTTIAIANGGTGLTSSPSMLTNLASTTAANILQASPRPGVTGTLGVGNGGTGQTSAKNAANAFLNALDTGSSTPVDADYYISQYVNGNATNTTTYHRRPMSALWSYINGKANNTYVTLTTAQTLTAAATKTYLGLQTYGSEGIALGTTSNSSVTQKANVKYDATREAIVFSFS